MELSQQVSAVCSLANLMPSVEAASVVLRNTCSLVEVGSVAFNARVCMEHTGMRI